MNVEVKSILFGVIFSFSHIIAVITALKYFKKVAPVFIHAISACGNLILLCLLSTVLLMHAWIAFSVLAFVVSSFLFVFGTVYKSMMIRILCFADRSEGTISIDQIDETIIIPTFTERCVLLVGMGRASIREGYYSLTEKGKKTANIIGGFRKLFNIDTGAMYRSEPKKSLWKQLLHFRLHSKYMIIIVYGLFATVYISGLYQKIYISADNRIKFHAIPIAISTLYQGHKHDYRGWFSTEKPFQGVNGVLKDRFIKKQRKAPVNKEEGHYHWVADDRGYADYVIAAFALFGPRMISLYHFWFLILFLSITLFVRSFGRHSWAMAYLAFLILGIHSAMSLLKLRHVDVPIFEPRYLEVLALVSVIHLIFVATFVEKKNFFKHLPPLIGQIAIFIFLYHARSSLGWQIVAVAFVSIVCVLIRRTWSNKSVPLWVAVFLITSSTILLPGYKHLTYHPSYFQNMGMRTFWHNALMGMQIKALPPNLVNDHTAAEVVLQYARESGCTSGLKELSAQDLLNSLGNWGTADWKEYEYWAKKLFLSLCRQHKLEVAQLYLVRKPWGAIKDTISPGIQYHKRTMPWAPLHLVYLIPFLLVLFGARHSLYVYQWKLLMITSLVFCCAIIPPAAFYLDILTHGGMSVMMVVMLYYGIITCFVVPSFQVYHRIKNYSGRVKVHETH